jgi:hypothetical protein
VLEGCSKVLIGELRKSEAHKKESIRNFAVGLIGMSHSLK